MDWLAYADLLIRISPPDVRERIAYNLNQLFQEWDEREHIRHQEREDADGREQLDLMRC
jgi:hypothetical protein